MMPLSEHIKVCERDVIFHCQVNMFKDDGEVIHFNNPKVQALPSSNTFSITGHAEIKRMANTYFYILHLYIHPS